MVGQNIAIQNNDFNSGMSYFSADWSYRCVSCVKATCLIFTSSVFAVA